MRRLAVRLVVVLGVAVVLAWAGPSVWWIAAECQSTCTPAADATEVRLTSGSVRMLSTLPEGDVVHVDYVTQNLRHESRLCTEVLEVFEALQEGGAVGASHKVIVSPTDPRRRLLGLTWRGPVFNCCEATGVVFTRTEPEGWTIPKGLCKGQAPHNKGMNLPRVGAGAEHSGRPVAPPKVAAQVMPGVRPTVAE